MSNSIDSFNAQFVILTLTIVAPIILVALGFCYRSRCTQVNLCYVMVHIHRDTQAEIASDIAMNNHSNNLSIGVAGPIPEILTGQLPEAINRV